MPAGEQLALLAHVLDRVVREALQRLADLLAARIRLRAHALEAEHLAARPSGSPLRSTSPTDPPSCRAFGDDHQRIAVGEHVEQRVVGQVDEQDARLDEQLRPQVRVAARRGGPQLSTAATPAAISSSAETRSMSS